MGALRSVRLARGLTRAALGALASLTAREVCHLERGARRGRPETWRKLAEVLEVPAEVLRLSRPR